jgi:hypothetical protein
VRRRELVLAAAGAALARPAAAAAALEGDPAILDRLIAREEAAAYAYGVAGLEPTDFEAHEREHAQALRTHLAALGREGPEAPGTAAELDRPARALGQAAGRPAVLDAAIALEASLLDAYRAALRELAEPSIAQTAATILAGHAQHRTLLRLESGRDPVG